MKRQSILILMIMLLSSATAGLGHPPSQLDIQFDKQEGLLSFHITHITKSISEHFVNQVEVRLNGKVLIKHEFLSQSSENGIDLLYRMHDGKPGDEIQVTVTCSVFGKKKEVFTIPNPSTKQ